jgi:hypothetical protein
MTYEHYKRQLEAAIDDFELSEVVNLLGDICFERAQRMERNEESRRLDAHGVTLKILASDIASKKVRDFSD